MAIFLLSGCLGGEQETTLNESQIKKGEYGIRISEWKAIADVFASGDQITLILDGKDIKDGTAPKNIFMTLLGRLGPINEEIGDIRDGGVLGAPEFTIQAPEVKSTSVLTPYTRLCYVYKTQASQEFWVVRAEDYPGKLEEPNMSSSINQAPVEAIINPSSPFPETQIRPIRVSERAVNTTLGIKLINRDEGFVANNTGEGTSFGQSSTITKVTVEVPNWEGNIAKLNSGSFEVCEQKEGSIRCNISNLRMTRGGTRVELPLKYSLPKGEKEKEDRIWVTASYRYCVLTDSIDVEVRKQY